MKDFRPFATSTVCLSCMRSAIILPVLISFTTVPTGTWINKSFAHRPCIFLMPPFSPFSALKTDLNLKSIRVDIFSVATR